METFFHTQVFNLLKITLPNAEELTVLLIISVFSSGFLKHLQIYSNVVLTPLSTVFYLTGILGSVCV